jgi:hypothetical protein
MTAQPPPQVPAYRDPTPDRQSNTAKADFLPPLRPRPKLFIALAILLICWLVAIVVMRFTTVHRDPAPATQLKN